MDGNDPNMNQPNSIYNNNNMPSTESNEGYNSQSNNIYSGVQSGFAPTSEGSIYSQVGGNIYSQNSGNIYQPPQNKSKYAVSPTDNIYQPPQLPNPIYAPPPSGNIYVSPPPINPPVYSPQISGEINTGNIPQVNVETNPGYIPQTSGNIVSPPVNLAPVNVTNPTESAATIPLISSSSVQVNVEGCCCSRIDESMAVLTGCQRGCTIFLGIFLAFGCLCCVIISSMIEGIEHNIFLGLDLLFLAYGIFISVSVLRIRWIRITSTTLSVIFFV